MGKSCPKCSRPMGEGFVVDHGDYGSKEVSSWHGGKPDRRWWGLKTDKNRNHEIVSWRCTGCGFLEDYAV